MQIIGEDHKVIYEGRDSYVAVMVPQGEGRAQITSYAMSPMFDSSHLRYVSNLVANTPEGYQYDIIYYQDIDSVLLGDGTVITIDPDDVVIVSDVSPSGRYMFYTNIAGDPKARSGLFINIIRILSKAAEANENPDAPPKPARKQRAATLPGMTGYDVQVLYRHNLLFNLFGDQMLALVCRSQTEYNYLIETLHGLHIITARSMMPSEWDGVSRYVLFDITRNTAFAVYNLPASVEEVLPYQTFVDRIAKDAADRLKRSKTAAPEQENKL